MLDWLTNSRLSVFILVQVPLLHSTNGESLDRVSCSDAWNEKLTAILIGLATRCRRSQVVGAINFNEQKIRFGKLTPVFTERKTWIKLLFSRYRVMWMGIVKLPRVVLAVARLSQPASNICIETSFKRLVFFFLFRKYFNSLTYL